jgi:hypothetical protein
MKQIIGKACGNNDLVSISASEVFHTRSKV